MDALFMWGPKLVTNNNQMVETCLTVTVILKIVEKEETSGSLLATTIKFSMQPNQI